MVPTVVHGSLRHVIIRSGVVQVPWVSRRVYCNVPLVDMIPHSTCARLPPSRFHHPRQSGFRSQEAPELLARPCRLASVDDKTP